MIQSAVSVRGLGKRYRLGNRQPYVRLTESLRDSFRRRGGDRSQPEFWALREVSFDVAQGEVIGIIGRNGAGKSTLLKILARITDPTEGEAVIHGRVGSLLEVGTGFHPELTGRENIYLSGSILGMKRTEIRRRFDEIVAFAEVDQFLDTPVKRYSSGMQVRLGFAVAAHLEPEVLIIDEVLAVGDAAFQRKSIGRMGTVAAEGRTVLIVSHNMGLIASLSRRALLLDGGRVVADGAPETVIRQHLDAASVESDGDVSLVDQERRGLGLTAYMSAIRLRTADGRPTSTFGQGEPIVLELEYDATGCPLPLAGAGFNLVAASGSRVGGFNNYMAHEPPHSIPQKGVVRFTLAGPALTPGAFWVTPSLGTDPRVVVDQVEFAASFIVEPRDVYGSGHLLTPEDGVVALECSFEVVR